MVILAYGILLACTPFMLLYSVLGINMNPWKWKKYLPWLVLAIGMIAYGMQSSVELDMDRYFNTAIEIGKYPFFELFNYKGSHGEYVGLWVIKIVFWLAGRLNVVHILPMMTGCIVYGIALYITCDVAEEYEAYTSIPKVIAVQICILPFVSIISNIRNITAFSLIILAVYLDIVKKKRNPLVLLLYVFPIFIHTSSIILILFRIGISFSVKSKIVFLTIVCALPVFIDTLYANINLLQHGGSIGAIITTLCRKGYWYLHDQNDTAWARQVASSRYQQINRVVMIILAITIVLIICFGIFQYVKKMYENFLTYIFLLAIMTISCSWFTTPHYWRFSAASIIAIGALLIPLLCTQNISEKILIILKRIFFLSAVMGVLLQLWPIQYNIDLMAWFENVILNNFYVMLFQLIKGMFLA